MEVEIKTCPFCGNAPVVNMVYPVGVTIYCENEEYAHAGFSGDDLVEVVEKWNTRVEPGVCPVKLKVVE